MNHLSVSDIRPDREMLYALLTDAQTSRDPRAWEQYMCAFHEAADRRRISSILRDSAGRTSYDLMVERVRAGEAADTLDIGCGDGFLTRMLREALPSSVTVTGLDVCATALQRAREVASPRHIEYVESSAGAIPYADERFGIVTAHLVLMLLQPIGATLSEIRRVLRPGGHAFFIVDLSEQTGGTLGCMRKLALDFLRDSFAGCIEPRLGDPRVKDRDSVRVLLEEAGLARDLQINDFEFSALMAPQAACNFLRDMYVFGSLDTKREAALFDLVLAQLREEVAGDGRLSLSLPLRMIAVRR